MTIYLEHLSYQFTSLSSVVFNMNEAGEYSPAAMDSLDCDRFFGL